MTGVQVGILIKRTYIFICPDPRLILWGRKLS